MKKKIIFSFILGMIVSGMSVYAGVSLSSEKIGYKDTTVKESLDNLFDESVSGKIKIAEAITNKGIETLDTDSYDKIVENINNIKSEATLLGRYSGNTTIDVSNIPNYSERTFLVANVSTSSIGGQYSMSSNYYTEGLSINSVSPRCSLDGSTLIITGAVASGIIYNGTSMAWTQSLSVSSSYDIFYI